MAPSPAARPTCAVDVRAVDAEGDRHLAGRGARDGVREQARAGRRGPLLDDLLVVLGVGEQAAQAGAEARGRRARAVVRSNLQAGVVRPPDTRPRERGGTGGRAARVRARLLGRAPRRGDLGHVRRRCARSSGLAARSRRPRNARPLLHRRAEGETTPRPVIDDAAGIVGYERPPSYPSRLARSGAARSPRCCRRTPTTSTARSSPTRAARRAAHDVERHRRHRAPRSRTVGGINPCAAPARRGWPRSCRRRRGCGRWRP